MNQISDKNKNSSSRSKSGQKKQKIPKRITESYLHNSGLYYLERFSASTEHFRKTMMRKIDRSCRHHQDQDREACITLLNHLTETFVRSGLLNDAQYAENMVHSLRRRGGSKRGIEAKLRTKGVPPALIRKFLGSMEEEDKDSEFKAALTFARKKRIGPFATRKREDENRKAMSAMARAGFGFDISRRVLACNDEDFTEEF